MRTKVVHLTSAHPPYDTRIFHKECRSLAAAGYQVVLIAPHTEEEVVEGIVIRAIPKARNRLERMVSTVFGVTKASLRENADVYHLHDPELIFAGVVLKIYGKQVVYDVHEDLPSQIAGKHWIPRPLRRPVAAAARWVERIFGALIDGVVAATPTIAERFPRTKTVTIQNYPLMGEYTTINDYSSRRPVIAYIGGISIIRGIREMIEAMELLNQQEVRLVLAGHFQPAELFTEVQAIPGWAQVDYVGWQTRQGVQAILNQSRIGLVILHPVPNYVESYPVKLFEYMAAGIPVVASDFPVWRGIIEDAGCGLLVDPMNPADIATAVKWLLENPKEAEAMGWRGRNAVRRRYHWGLEEHKLLSFYHNLIVSD